MKLSDDARNAIETLFDEDGFLEDAFILNGWPYCSMTPEDIQKLKSGLMELEAFGLVRREMHTVHGRRIRRVRLAAKKSEEPEWAKGIDPKLPPQ